ncbi:MAG: hypothetical protein SFW09_08650 [Hyphomicrobiaceae bacterium]|nr:hypothetical protein [Hyphomicrobiaceae bacterium]
MTDQKDGSGKAADRGPADSGGAKRPYATLDLKAVEVPGGAAKAASGPRPPEPAQPRAQADAARKVAAASAAQSDKAAVSAASVPPAGSRPTSAASAAKAETGKAGSAGAAGAPAAAVQAPPAARGGSSLGRFFTHAVAGVVGGGLALYGAPHLAPVLRDMGLPVPAATVPPEVDTRLAAIERRLAAPAKVDPAADPARALSAAEANRKRLDEVAATVGSLAEAQAKLAKLTSELEARVGKEVAAADTAERISKLEQQLSALADAAKTEPANAGRIPQLARLTGRLDELEATSARNQADLRKELVREIDKRATPTAEASEVARATAQRVEREVAAVRTEQNRLATGLDQVRTSTDRLQLALKATQDETTTLVTAIDGLRRDVDGRLKAMAKPADVSSAIAPVASKLTSLEESLTGVVKSEAERKATAERIVLALELGNLKRAMERGAPYERELAEVRKVAGSQIDLAPLDRYRQQGVATIAGLAAEFRPAANAILDAEAEKGDGTVVDRLLSGAKSFVRVRKTGHGAGDGSAEAIVARMEAALKAGRLGDVLTEAKALPQVPPGAKEWLAKVEARQTVDAALTSIDAALKSSLGAGPAPAAQKKATP